MPNNWDLQADAAADAPGRHKAAGDARRIGATGWYKICDDRCTMKVSGLDLTGYDEPCVDRMHFVVLDTATND